MSAFSRLRIWVQRVFGREQLDRDLHDEMQLHIDLYEADLRGRGVPAGEAHRRARAAFGSTLARREEVRQVLGLQLIDELRSDVIYACRLLRRSPMFAAVAILSLGLGIGANAAIFNLIDTVLLKSLPVQDPSTLFFIDNSGGKSQGNSGPPYPCFEILRQSNTTLSGIAAFDDGLFKVTIDGEAEEVRGQYASGNFFEVLGVRPAYGRLLLASDDATMVSGADGAVAVISHGFWQRRFNFNPAVVGKTIVIGARPVTIVGVTPPEYFGLQVGLPKDVTVPITLSENNLGARSLWWFSVVARIKPGVPVEAARAELHGLWDRYMTDIGELPEKRKYFSGIELVPAARGLAELRRQLSEPLLIVMTIVGIVLLIGCANIANLLLARASARQNELSVRLAVGASRGRLIRQLLTEGVVLSAAGAIAALVIARWGTAVIVSMLARADNGAPIDAPLDLRLVSFIAMVGVAAAMLFSLVPAIQSTRSDGARPAAQGMTQMVAVKGRLGQSLVVLQVTLSLILLSAAVLFVRTLQNLENLDSGFSPRNVIALTVETQLPRPPRIAKPTPADVVAYYTQIGQAWTALGDRIAALPGVQASAIATMVPLTGRDRGVLAGVSGGPPLTEEQRYIHINHVTSGFFATLRIPLTAGRYFTPADRAGAPRVAILNHSAARAYFGETNPIGRRVNFPGQRVEDEFEVVGVVGDVRYQNARTEDERMAYLPIEQTIDGGRSGVVIVRTTVPDEHLFRDEIAKGITGGFAPRLESLGEMARASLTRERLLSMLASIFGVLALLLACIGLYGIMAYGVMRRTREIGIRLAVGASRRSVMWMMLRETLIVVTIGVLAGAIGVVPATRALRNQLFGVTPADPASLVIAIVMLVAVAAIAGYVPARRATRIDPLSALRCE